MPKHSSTCKVPPFAWLSDVEQKVLHTMAGRDRKRSRSRSRSLSESPDRCAASAIMSNVHRERPSKRDNSFLTYHCSVYRRRRSSSRSNSGGSSVSRSRSPTPKPRRAAAQDRHYRRKGGGEVKEEKTAERYVLRPACLALGRCAASAARPGLHAMESICHAAYQ